MKQVIKKIKRKIRNSELGYKSEIDRRVYCTNTFIYRIEKDDITII